MSIKTCAITDGQFVNIQFDNLNQFSCDRVSNEKSSYTTAQCAN